MIFCLVTVAFPGPKGRVGHPDLTQNIGQNPIPGSVPARARARTSASHASAVRFVKYPARGHAWTLRELAPTLGCSIGTLSHISSGTRKTVPAELAERFCEAVGVETLTLFAPVVSAKVSGTNEGVA